MTSMPSLVVFSDLDGTLLDHANYDWQPAVPALNRLAKIGAAVVLASSKTAAEITVLQDEMGLGHWPAIVENGAGLLGRQTTPQYDALRHALTQIPQDMRRKFTGFGDMNTQAVADCTGLPQDVANLAKNRMFSEPGLWSGTDHQQTEFITALAALGVSARHGGRFLTLSFGKTKATQMAEIMAQYQPRHTIALGDAPNDIEMLETADTGIIIANPHRAALPPLPGEATGRVWRTTDTGPIGWNSAIMAMLDQLEFE